MTATIEAGRPLAPGSDAARRLALLAPVLAALAYPFALKAFHHAAGQPDAPASVVGTGLAALCLLAASSVPLLGLALAAGLSRAEDPSAFELRARRLSYFAMAAPPLYVFTGVARGLIGRPLSDETIWIGFWLLVLLAGLVRTRGKDPAPARDAASARPLTSLRIAHGASAAVIASFVLFHLANHSSGWLGTDTHTAIMHAGRTVYRLPMVEALLVALLLFQVASGVRLAWRQSARPVDGYGAFQIGSGVFLAAFFVTHLQSALLSARIMRGAETDWGWAVGAPTGLIYDEWNIRLLPHYLFGVFFILAHLASGLRQVLLAHGTPAATANRIWLAGLVGSALIALAIMAGLVGARIQGPDI